MYSTSTQSHYACNIMPFLDIKVKEGIEHISDKEEEEGMEDDMDIYGVGVHCFTLTTLNVLITL